MKLNSVIEDLEYKIIKKKSTLSSLKSPTIELCESHIKELELLLIDLQYVESLNKIDERSYSFSS